MPGPVDAAAVRAAIERIGYAVVPDVVDRAVLDRLRGFWLAEYAKPCPAAPMVWGPYLGEPGGILFDDGPTHCLYRSFDYLWNPPTDPLTREVALALNRARNRIVEEDERYGELMEPERYGIYVTTSYYPCGSGWMHMHPDEARGRRHWHFILPLTYRGVHYAAGGLALVDRQGARVDIEERVSPGSVIFYDGALSHGVDRIEGADGLRTGRLQLFAIPTFFELPSQNRRHVADIPAATFLRARLSRLKWRLLKGTKR
jgi:hypothetical protein